MKQPTSSRMSVKQAAHSAREAGFSVVPVKEDGSKAPDLPEWTSCRTARPSQGELDAWFGCGKRTGLGLVMGAVSRNAELFEFDCRETYEAFIKTARACGLGELIDRIEFGYCEDTPGGGVHWLYRCEQMGGNTKLARRPKRPDEQQHPNDKIKTLIETRGEGGFVVIAPSHGGVHQTGKPYTLRSGGFGTIAQISPDERQALFTLARTFDQLADNPREFSEARTASKCGGRPGDEFATWTTWPEILEPHGWTPVYERAGTTYWCRPGKTVGISATTNYAGSDLLYPFSTSTEFAAERGYGKFAAYAVLDHGGDFSAAAKALRKGGFGDPEKGPRASLSPKPDATADEAFSEEKPEDWGSSLAWHANGGLRAVAGNAALILANDEEWRGVFGLDELSARVVIRKQPPALAGGGLVVPSPGVLRDEDLTFIGHALLTRNRLNVIKPRIRDAVVAAARASRFHPVREYLDSLCWDGQPRLDEWLVRYCGAKDNLYVRAVGEATLIGAVARVRQPGCKLDTMLILEGGQGIAKSRLLRILARDRWFRERTPALDSKDAMIHLLGAWIVEWGELSGLTKHDVQQVKEFLSVQADHYRAPYDRVGNDHPRQCIFIGSTNDDTYLQDDTGNRRFWPVRVTRIDLAAFERDIDQLWAEADCRYQQGKDWWLPPELEIEAQEEQRARKTEDPWLDDVQRYVVGKSRVTIVEILVRAIRLRPERRDQGAAKRVAACLKDLGWTRRQRRIGSGRTWVYEPSTLDDESDADGDPTATTATGSEEGTGDTSDPWDAGLVTTSPGVTSKNREIGKEEGDRGQQGQKSKYGETSGSSGDVVTSDPDGVAL